MDGLGTPTSRLSIAAPSTNVANPPVRELLYCDPNAGTGCTLSDVRGPSYSPDGKRIVFDGGERIAIVDADGDNLTVLPAVTDDDGDPAFSPDGRRIAFTGRNDAGGTDVYTRRVNGRGARLVVEDADEPAWSSRGALAWVRDRKVYVSAADGSRERLVTGGINPTGRRTAGAFCWCGRPGQNGSMGGSTWLGRPGAGCGPCAGLWARIPCGPRMAGRRLRHPRAGRIREGVRPARAADRGRIPGRRQRLPPRVSSDLATAAAGR
jgi:WD40-like Beta Propeller Repeat